MGSRYAKEEQATDSYQNLLFSILRFHEITGRYPDGIVVVTHAFKEKRFLKLHGPAIRWPTNKLRLRGLNPDYTMEEMEETHQLEYDNAYKLFEGDPYATHPPLSDKRLKRYWKPEVANGLSNDKNVQQLLAWVWQCGIGPCMPSH